MRVLEGKNVLQSPHFVLSFKIFWVLEVTTDQCRLKCIILLRNDHTQRNGCSLNPEENENNLRTLQICRSP